jgi:transcriptional regulator with XRE-family HTH domain
MEASRKAATMTAEDFTAALGALGWKQADFARRAGIGDEAVSRWARGSVRVAPWVPAFLGMATALHEVHRQYVAPKGRE